VIYQRIAIKLLSQVILAALMMKWIRVHLTSPTTRERPRFTMKYKASVRKYRKAGNKSNFKGFEVQYESWLVVQPHALAARAAAADWCRAESEIQV
jgi:hypothetical protein